MVSYICLTQNAVKEIISQRKLQSLDYQEASFLLDIANAVIPRISISGLSVVSSDTGRGIIVLHSDDNYESERNSLTLDFSTLRFEELSDSLKVSCLHKLLRFSVKYWENLGHSSSEIIPLESTKGIIFPFSSSYRIVTELAPFKDKANKVNKYKGKHIVSYKFGKSLGAGNREECETSNLKKALDLLFSVETFSGNRAEKSKSSSSGDHRAINLHSDELLNTTNLLGRNNPLELLSDKQRSFVTSDWNHPARINGPAGSGKTICLVLKAIFAFKNRGRNFRILFVVPSNAVRNTVEYFLKVSASAEGIDDEELFDCVSVRTIQQVCLELLVRDINSSELIDEDNFEAKQNQLLYVMEIVEQEKLSVSSHKPFISEDLFKFFSEEDSLAIAEVLVHEFGIIIKGRCGSLRESYIKADHIKYGVPVRGDNDKYFLFEIFEKYQSKLDMLGQFDPDDIALSAMGKLESPIWKRRRAHEGYNLVLIDELHLMNFNELCLIHYLTTDFSKAPISFAVDATQTIGDIAWRDSSVLEYLHIDGFENDEEITNLTAVFRCSESITKLASSITSSGASLFTNFNDPLANSTDMQSGFDNFTPKYHLLEFDKTSIHESAIQLADEIRSDLDCHRHRIVIIYFDRFLFEEARSEFQQQNKAVSYLEERGDISVIEKAKNKNDYVLALAEYVGGLEFDAVILVGVDRGRVPREEKTNTAAASLFQNYVAHNKMYVSVTRATRVVYIIGEKRRGISQILNKAVEDGVIKII